MASAYGETEETSLRDVFILKQRWETAESRRWERKSRVCAAVVVALSFELEFHSVAAQEYVGKSWVKAGNLARTDE